MGIIWRENQWSAWIWTKVTSNGETELIWLQLSRVVLCCREGDYIQCLLLTRISLQGQGGSYPWKQNLCNMCASLWFNCCSMKYLWFVMTYSSFHPCALQMTLSPLSPFWSVGHLEDLPGPSNSVFYQEELKQIKRSLSKPIKKSLT